MSAPPGTQARPPPATVEDAANLPSAVAIRQRLIEESTSDARREILQGFGMSQKQARDLAKDLGVKGASRLGTDKAIEKVVEYFADFDYARDDLVRT
jgi:hypothetical protein